MQVCVVFAREIRWRRPFSDASGGDHGECFDGHRGADLGLGLHRRCWSDGSGNPGERSTGGAHGLHFGPLAGVFEAHVVANGVRVSEAASALDHRTDWTVPGIVPVQMLPEDSRFQWDFAEWTG